MFGKVGLSFKVVLSVKNYTCNLICVMPKYQSLSAEDNVKKHFC